jgi:hypothetical protein
MGPLLSFFFFFIFIFCSIGVSTQSLALARQEVYHLNHAPECPETFLEHQIPSEL